MSKQVKLTATTDVRNEQEINYRGSKNENELPGECHTCLHSLSMPALPSANQCAM